MIEPGDLVFDIGALDGKYTDRYLAQGARVVAVEPQAGRAAMLAEKYAACNVTVVQKAVGAAPGTGELFLTAHPWLATMDPGKWKTGRFAGYVWNASQPVEIVTLDSLIAEYGIPAFTKIDVEGFETQALQGLSQPLPWLSYEFTGEFLDDARACAKLLQQLGQYEFAIAYGEGQPDKYWSLACVMAELRVSKMPQLWGDIYARAING